MNVLRSLINVNGILCNEHHIANGTPLICDVIIAMKLCVGQVGRKCRKVVIFGLNEVIVHDSADRWPETNPFKLFNMLHGSETAVQIRNFID